MNHRKITRWLYRVCGVTAIVLASCYVGLFAYTKQNPKATWLEQIANSYLPYSTEYEAVEFIWSGFKPGISVHHFKMYNEAQPELPQLVIEKVNLLWSIPEILFSRQHVLSELILIGARFSLYTDDHVNFEMGGLPQLNFSLDKRKSQAPIKKIVVKKSDILFSKSDKKFLAFTQANLKFSTDDRNKISGNATLLSDKPIYFNFNHTIIEQDKTHQWYLSMIGEISDAISNYLPHQYNYQWKAKSNVQAWVNQYVDHVEFAVQADIKHASIHKENSVLDFQKFNAFIFGQHAQETGWEVNGKNIQIVQPKMNNTPLVSLNDNQFQLSYKKDNDKHKWLLKTEDVPVSLAREALQYVSKNELEKLNKFWGQSGNIKYLDLGIFHHENQCQLDHINTYLQAVTLNTEKLKISPFDLMFSFSGKQGKFQFISKQGQILEQNWFSTPISYNNLSTVADFSYSDEVLNVTAREFVMDIEDATIKSEFNLILDDKDPKIDLGLSLENFQLDKLNQYIPSKKLNPKLNVWLKNAFQKGVAHNGHMVIRGPLKSFPFADQEGTFQVYTDLKDVDLDFHPKWPVLKNTDLQLRVENKSLFIESNNGELLNLPTQKVKAQIYDLTQKPTILKTEIVSDATLEAGVNVIKNSPLAPKLGSVLSPFKLQGDMALSLSIDLPLSAQHKQDIKVRGIIESQDAKAYLEKQDILVENIQGRFKFTEKDLSANKVNSKVWNKDTTFDIDSKFRNEKLTHVQVEGHANVNHALKHFLKKDFNWIKGDSSYQLDISMVGEESGKSNFFHINSDLVGVDIDLPDQFGKQADSEQKLSLKGILQPNGVSKYSLKMPSYHLTLSTERRNDGSPEWVGGHLYCGETQRAAFRQDHKFLIEGQLGKIDLMYYLKELKAKRDHFLNQVPENSPIKSSKYLLVEPVLKMGIEDLILNGYRATNVRLEGQYDKNYDNWQFSINSPEVSGYLVLPRNDQSRMTVIELDKLITEPSQEPNTNLTKSWSPTTWQRPLEIKINQISHKQYHAKNVYIRLEPIQYGYHIEHLNFNLKDTDIETSGYWHDLSSHPQVDINGKISTKNITSTLNALGLKGSLRQAKGDINLALSWEGHPLSINTDTLSGEFDFKLNKGLVQGVNPGFGRILSLLNIDNIQRRLNLDFSDVTKEGMSFDLLKGKIHILEGSVHSDKVVLDSPSAKIEMTFRTRFDTHHLNGNLVVMPNITGSLPIAAAIAAGNPAVGAAVWVMDKLLGKKIQEINKYQYRLMGSWEDPKIKQFNQQITAKRASG